MKAVYTGHEALTFMDYLDLGTGRTLTAEPGGTYDVGTVSAGRPLPPLPPMFTPAQAEKPAEKEIKPAKAAEDSAPEVSE